MTNTNPTIAPRPDNFVALDDEIPQTQRAEREIAKANPPKSRGQARLGVPQEDSISPIPKLRDMRAVHSKLTDEQFSSRDRSAEQLTFGPSEAVKQKPTIARLRDAMNDFNIRGTRRLVAYELLTYWQPGGDVFPSVQTIADGLGLTPRVVQRHLARLERKGLWVRIARVNSTNLYELKLPGRVTVATGGGERSVTPGVNVASPRSNQLEVTSTKGPDVAATEAPPPNDARQRKQQQQPDYRYEERERNDTRYEGLVSICAAKSRELGRPFDESDARQRLTVHDLQRLADEIQHEIAIVDADSDTRRMKEDEQVTENAQALADEQAQARKQAAADEQAAIKARDAKEEADRPLIKQHFANMREIARRAKKKHPAVKSDRYRRSSGPDATA